MIFDCNLIVHIMCCYVTRTFVGSTINHSCSQFFAFCSDFRLTRQTSDAGHESGIGSDSDSGNSAVFYDCVDATNPTPVCIYAAPGFAVTSPNIKTSLGCYSDVFNNDQYYDMLHDSLITWRLEVSKCYDYQTVWPHGHHRDLQFERNPARLSVDSNNNSDGRGINSEYSTEGMTVISNTVPLATSVIHNVPNGARKQLFSNSSGEINHASSQPYDRSMSDENQQELNFARRTYVKKENQYFQRVEPLTGAHMTSSNPQLHENLINYTVHGLGLGTSCPH